MSNIERDLAEKSAVYPRYFIILLVLKYNFLTNDIQDLAKITFVSAIYIYIYLYKFEANFIYLDILKLDLLNF